MVASIPKGLYNMKNRYVIIKHNHKKYKRASKKIKTAMLNELSEILHMNKQYLGYLLRNSGKIIKNKNANATIVGDPTRNNLSKRGRKRVYGKEVLEILKVLYRISGYVSSKHLVWFIRINHEKLFENPKIKSNLTDDIKALLLRISPATVDRLLKPYRDKIKLKKRYGGNPFSSNLKKSIAVESWFDKQREPGVVEIDLVHHSGASGTGEFVYTLTATEISTGWTELRPIKNKAMIWTRKALEDIYKTMPVPLRKLHSDNGSEFINAHVKRFCMENKIEFTRSRPYRKNDSCYVESKNWSMVKFYTGWNRYDTDEELKVLQVLLKLVCLKNNLFMPQMKYIEKIRINGKIIKRYEIDTPLNRVLRLKEVDEKVKSDLLRLRDAIDIAELSKEIERVTEELFLTYNKKLKRRNNYA